MRKTPETRTLSTNFLTRKSFLGLTQSLLLPPTATSSCSRTTGGKEELACLFFLEVTEFVQWNPSSLCSSSLFLFASLGGCHTCYSACGCLGQGLRMLLVSARGSLPQTLLTRQGVLLDLIPSSKGHGISLGRPGTFQKRTSLVNDSQ